MSIVRISCISFAVACLSFSPLSAETLMMDSNSRLSGVISKKGMTRLSIKNDRIEAVYGDSQAFISEADPKSGQLFLRLNPTFEGSNIYVSVISENGQSQDLKLVVKDVPASSIILEEELGIEHTPVVNTPYHDHEMDQENLALVAIKDLARGAGKSCSSTVSNPTPHHPHLKVELLQSLCLPGGWHGYTFSLTNISKENLVLSEENFWEIDDEAIALTHYSLKPGVSGQLLIVRKTGEHHG